MKCPNCGAESPRDRKFCSKCGAILTTDTQKCPVCGTMNPADNKFCRTCAANLLGLISEMPPPPEVKLSGIQCPRCDTDNSRDKRFCRRCGARLVEPAQRMEEIIAELASMQDKLSRLPATIVTEEMTTLEGLEKQVSEAQQAYDGGDNASGGQLLTTIERTSSKLTERIARLQQGAKLVEQAERGQERMVTAIEKAKESLPHLTLVKASPLEKAIRRLETRLASGQKALEQDQFKRAQTILSSASAEKEIKKLNDQLIVLQGKQQEVEGLKKQLEDQIVDLSARVESMRQELATMSLESPKIERELALISKKLTQSQAMKEREDLTRARQIVNSIEANLDALERDQLATVKERKDSVAFKVSLTQQSHTLRERMKLLQEDLRTLTHTDTTGQLETLAQLEEKLRVAETADDHAKIEEELDKIRHGLHELRQQLPELYFMERQIPDLLDRIVVLREGYETLQQELVGLGRPDVAPELQSVEENLALLAEVSAKKRFESPQPLQELLNNITDPTQLKEELIAKVEAEEDMAQLLAQAHTKVGALMQDLKEAQQEGAALPLEEEELGQMKAILGRVEELQIQGKTQQAADGLRKIKMHRLDELKKKIEDKLSRTKLLQMKTTLSLTKMPEAGGVTNYNVLLNISGAGWQDAPAIQGSIKVAYHDRVDMRKAIDDLTTVINVLFGAQGTLRGKMPEVPENQALDSLSELGDLMYRLFLPTIIQRHLKEVESPVLIASNDLELPWELMYPENEFLCLRAPVGRMPMMRDFPRRNEYKREEQLHFLFIANPTGDLSATEKEVEWIADRLSDEPAKVEIWKGDEVTGLKLHRALASGRYDVIHYSGHAYFNPENPDESGLLLAGQNVFIAQTIQRTLRGRPLVFLNACESGREMMADGEVSYTTSETEGLASSFILGGALGIIGTMWPIFDEGAAEFGSNFYENLLAGKTLGEAVRQARLHVKESRPHDVTWASFMLYGDPTLNILE
jgi:hypothetical protein